MALVGASFAAIALAFWYVRDLGVNLLYADEWAMVDLLVAREDGTLSLGQLLEAHNEHRYLLPRLVALATDFDSVRQMHVVVLALALTTLFVYLVFSGLVGGWRLLLFAPVPFLLMGFRHHENLLWGLQTSFALALAFSVGAFWMLGRGGGWSLGGAAAFAAMAMLSAAQGLFAWPAGLLQLLSAGRWRAAAAWGLAGTSAWALYLGGGINPGSGGPPTYVLEHPVEGATYFVALLGGSLSFDPGFALAFGAALLAPLAAAVVAGRETAWFGVLTFSLLCLLSITAGRVSLGVFEGSSPATASRYALFSSLCLAGVYGVFAWRWARGSTVYGVLSVALAAAMVVGLAHGYTEGARRGAFTEAAREVRAEQFVESVEHGREIPGDNPNLYTETPDPLGALVRYEKNLFDGE